MTKQEAKKILAVLKVAYPDSRMFINLTPADVEAMATLWAMQFNNIPANVVMIAVNKWISTNTFAPKINEVKERIRGLYWEARGMLDRHEQALEHNLGKPLPPAKLQAVIEILKVCEPMRTMQLLEPTLDSLLSNYNDYLTGSECVETKQLKGK